jgi:carboxyl-terminal processing protease
MTTLCAMFKRILTLLTGALLGIAVYVAVSRVGAAWSLLPNRDLDKSSGYVKEVLKIVHENYVDADASKYDNLARHALHGMVESLDPHSEFLEAKDNQAFDEDLNGEYGGIGIEVEARKGAYCVIAPIPGSPGDKAGLLTGDVIESIDGRPIKPGTAMDDVVDKLRGKIHTHVRLGVLRPGTGRRMNLDLVREEIKMVSVRGTRILNEATGYIQVRDFSDQTGQQFIDALNGLLKKGIDSLVIDLRNNPGGLIDAAVSVAEPYFKKDQLIVYTQGRNPEDKESYLSETDGPPLQIPTVVLVNGETASAAEIVSGALKDTGKAVIVGERTYGKGSVQSKFELRNGEGMRLTTAHYFTPSGTLIHGKGITPHVEVVLTEEDDRKIERQLSRPEITDPADFKDRFGFEPIEDRQLAVALDILAAQRLLAK